MHAFYRGAFSRRLQTRAFIAALLMTTCAVGTANATVFNVTDQASYDAAVAAANSSAGPHVINIAAGSYVQNVNATFNGTINIDSGATLTGIANDQFNTGLTVTVASGATFATGEFTQNLGNFGGEGTLDAGTTSAGILNFGYDNGNSAFDGDILKTIADGAAQKVGTGSFTLDNLDMAQGEFRGIGGTLIQSSGTTNMKYIAVGTSAVGNAVMNITSGTLNVNGSVTSTPCGSNCPALQVGDFGGVGIVNQSGGTVIIGDGGVGGSLNIGNQGGNGTYNLSGGILQLGSTTDVTAGNYSIGRSTGATRNSVGVLNISGTGLLDMQGGFFVNGDRDSAGAGATTSSTITQTGGTFRVGAGTTLYLAGADNANAIDSTYNLNGGTLEVGGSGLQAHYAPAGTTATYAFNMGGGTIKVIGSALTTASDVNATLTAATMSTIDTNGLGATWNGVFSGAGGLNKTGAGTLTVNGANTYTGATHVIGGTLQAGSSSALSSSTAVTIDAGTTLDFTNTTQSIGSLAGSGTVQLGSTGFFFTGNDNTNTSFSGTIVQSAPQTGAVGKVGTGTWNISGMTMAEGEFYDIQGTLAQTTSSTNIKYLAVGTGTGDSADMTVSGGTLNITGNYPGMPAICGSSCPSLQVGDFGGTGVLTQTAGTVVIGAPGVGGSLNVGNQGGNGTYNISGGTLQLGVFGDVNSAGLYSIGRQQTSNAAFANSTGLMSLSGTGLVDVQAGELIVGDRDSGGAAGAVTSSTLTMTGGTLRVRQGANLWLSAFDNGNAIDSTFNLNGGTLEIGDGRLQAGYGGGTGTYVFNMGAGTIKVIDADLVTSVHGTLNGGSVATGTTINTNGFNATWNGVLDGTGWLVKTGAGTLKLEAVNTYTGGTAFNGGTVFVDVDTDLGATTAAMSFNGGTLQLGANSVLATRTGGTNMAGAGTIDTNGFSSVYDGNITGSGALTKIGAGTLDLGGNNNAHAGAVNVNAGQLNAFGGNGAGDTSAVTVAGGATFRVYGAASETIGSLAGAGSLLLGTERLVTGGNNGSTTWSGTTDAGTGGITKTGTGTMTVNANLSYTGVTNVNGGTLLLNGTAADSVVVNSGGTFGGNSVISGNLTLNAGGHLAPGNSPGSTIVLGNYTGGGIYDAQVAFNNAATAIPGVDNDLLSIGGNVSGTTLINVAAIAPSNAPTATTGFGVLLVAVGGNVAANQFQLAGPVFQGGYEYLLAYEQNYVGNTDGFFLQSVARDELWGQAAMLTAGQAMTDRCFRGEDRQAAAGDDRRGRAWATVTSGSRSTGADTGVDSDQDYTCGSGGIDIATGDAMRVGLSGGYGNTSVDVTTPSGTGKLDGDQGVVEAYMTWAKSHVFINVSAGYSTTDWSFDAPLSGHSDATVDGFIAAAQAGARWGMGNVRAGLSAQLDYDGTKCGDTCFVAGVTEDVAKLRAKGAARLDGMFSDGTIQPFVQVGIEDNLDGTNSAGIGAAAVESDTGLLLTADAGLTAFVSKNFALFAGVGVTSGLDKDVNGFDGQGGVKLTW
jgi:autotransporter-associated beta strand protein